MRTLNEMKETIKINHENNTIEMTKQFAKASGVFGSDAYKMLLEAKKQLPNYKVVIKATPTRKQTKDNYKGLTYDYMERYISTKDNKDKLMEEYNKLRGIGTGHDEIIKKAPYSKVKKWFLTTFQEINDYTEERKEAWEVIEVKAKEQKEQKARNENENNENDNTAVNVPAVMINTANTTTLMN